MDFGKVAYTKVLEIERNLGMENRESGLFLYESTNVENLAVSAGEYTVDFGLIEPKSQNVCVMIKGKIKQDNATKIKFLLLVDGEEIDDFESDEQSSFDMDFVKVVEAHGEPKHVQMKIVSDHDFVVQKMSMVCLNGASENNQKYSEIEIRTTKTPDGTFIVSYTKNNQIFATEVDTQKSLELNFDVIMDGVISHSFAFDKNGQLFLFYVTMNGNLFVRKVGGVINDQKIGEGFAVVCAGTAPEKSSDGVLVCAIKHGGKDAFYCSIFDDFVGNLCAFDLPKNKVFVDVTMVASEEFAYVAFTSTDHQNYVLKSAFDPLGKTMFEVVNASYVLVSRKYNTALETDKSAESIIASYEITARSAINFASIIEGLSVSHLMGSYQIDHSIYSESERTILYTVQIDRYNPDPDARCVYLDDCVGLLPMRNVFNDETATNDKLVSNGWDERWPFAYVKPCAMQEGKFVNYLDKMNYDKFIDDTLVGAESSGSSILDIMVEIPKIYYCIESVDDKINVHISNKKIDDRFVCNAHVYDGVELDKIYVSVYGSVIKSYKNASAFFSQTGTNIPIMGSTAPTFANFDTYIKSKPTGYRLWNFDLMVLFQCLFIIACKSTDSASSFGYGVNGMGGLGATGSTDQKGMFYGNTAKSSILKFMGIENLFGSHGHRIDEIVMQGGYDFDVFKILKRNPYSTVPINKNGDGYDVVATNPEFDGKRLSTKYLINPYGTTMLGFLPQSELLDGIAGSQTTYFCDAVDIRAGYGLHFGGDYNDYEKSGIFSYWCERGGSNVSGQYKDFRMVFYPIEGV